MSKENTFSAPEKPGAGGFIEEWGGKLALFFSYTHFSHDLTTGLLVALLPFIREELGLNYLQSGLLTSALALTSGFSQFLGGWLGDRLNRVRAMAIGLAGVGLCTFAVGLMPSYYLILAILVVQGIIAGAYHPSAVSSVTGSFEEARRGRAMALHMMGGSVGFLLGPFLGAPLASILGWRHAFEILALPAVVASFFVITRLKLPAAVSMPKTSPQAGTPNKSLGEVFHVFRSLASVFILVIIVNLIMGPSISFLSLFLVDRHHLSTAAAAIWISVVRLGGLIGSLFGGWLSDKWGRRRAVLLMLVLIGPVLYLLTHLPFNAALIVVFIIFGALWSGREATMQTYLMNSTPAHIRATVFGIYFGIGQEGSSLMQPLVGYFADIIGIYGVFGVLAYVGIGVSVLAVIVALRRSR